MSVVGGGLWRVIVAVAVMASVIAAPAPAVERQDRRHDACSIQPAAGASARIREVRPHPRLLAGRSDFARVLRLSERDAVASAWRRQIVRRAEAMVGQAPSRPWKRDSKLYLQGLDQMQAGVHHLGFWYAAQAVVRDVEYTQFWLTYDPL